MENVRHVIHEGKGARKLIGEDKDQGCHDGGSGFPIDYIQAQAMYPQKKNGKKDGKLNKGWFMVNFFIFLKFLISNERNII